MILNLFDFINELKKKSDI